MQSLIGQTLGAYQIVDQIGMGGMATIYRAYHAAMDRYVAVKVLPQQMAAEDATFMGRFEQEAKTIANLEHRHILPVYDYGKDQGYTYLVMRYIDAGTLKDLIEKGPIPPEQVMRLTRQVAEALGYAHRQGVIHRDIKPSNVMLDNSGNVYLMDFGIAKMLSGSTKFTGTDMLIGTPAYMSPEQAQGDPADGRSDIYSLGVMLYEMVTGQVPYEAETPMAVLLKHMQAPLPPPRTIKTNLPPALEKIILKAMAKDPDMRFQSGDDMAAALEQAVAKAPTKQIPPTRVMDAEPTVIVSRETAPEKVGFLTPMRLVIGSAVVVLIAVLGLLLATGGASDTGDVGAPGNANAPTGRAAWEHYVSTEVVGDMFLIDNEIYAATSGGLVRWTLDGQATQYTPADGMPFSQINTLIVAPDGSFWLGGHETGVADIVVEDDQVVGYEMYDFEDGLSGDIVNDILLDDEGNVWVAMAYSDRLIDYYDGETWHNEPPIPLDDPALTALGTDVFVITRDDNGATWLGLEAGLARWDPEAGSWSTFRTDQPVRIIYSDRESNLFAAAGNMIWGSYWARLDDTWEARPEMILDCEVNGMLQTADNSYWLACGDNVIHYEEDHERQTVYGRDDGVPGYTTGSLLETPDGRIWVGTVNGLAVFDGQRWIALHTENAAPMGEMAFLQETADGRIWTANREWEAYAWSFDPATRTWKMFDLDTGGISGFAVDDSGASPVLWITSHADTLIEYRAEDGRSRRYTQEDGLLTALRPYSLALDHSGSLWIGVLEGVYRRSPDDGSFTLYDTDADGELLDSITHLYVAPDGTLWAGHRGWERNSRAGSVSSVMELAISEMRNALDALGQSPISDEVQQSLDNLAVAMRVVEASTDDVWAVFDAGNDTRQTAADNFASTIDALSLAHATLSDITDSMADDITDETWNLLAIVDTQRDQIVNVAPIFVEVSLGEWNSEPNFIFRYDPENDTFHQLSGANSPAQSNDPYLHDLNTDGAGGLLVTIGYDALYHWDGDSWDRFNRDDDNAPEGQQLAAAAAGPDGQLWVASPETGLYTQGGFGWSLLPWDETLGTTRIYDLLVANDGTLWVSTDNGLIHLIGAP